MIAAIFSGAHRLDDWLHKRLGRPYRIVLAVGLAAAIADSLHSLGHAVASGVTVLKIVVMVMFQLALLINQLGQFHDIRQRARSAAMAPE